MISRQAVRRCVVRLGIVMSFALSWSVGASASPWVDVMVEGHEPSAVTRFIERTATGAGLTAAVAETRLQISRIEREQAELETLLSGPDWGAVPLFRTQRVLNGIALRIRADRVGDLRGLPQVRRVRLKRSAHLTNETSVPFLGAPEVWQAKGFTGAGLRIGVIDSGVDYLHTGFGGSGWAADYAANDTTTAADGFFPTAKVMGGWDFVGDAYDASSDDPAVFTPAPDPDPMDCEGHGSHVAGTVAGFGVSADGSTFPGPYDAAIDFDAFRIGPGVAPEASIYALRVFGCSGTSNVVEAALEWAVDPNGDGDFSDRLDVVNLSLASRFGTASDPAAEAADQAVAVGVVVVASAGNDGDVSFISGSPAVADGALSVAAVWDGDDTFPALGVRVDSPSLPASSHQVGGANFGPAVPLTGIDGAAAVAEPLQACSPLANPGEIAGRIALVQRSDDCSFVTQVRHAQQAGALAVIVVNDRPELQGLLNDGTGGDITVSSVLMRQAAGEAVIDALSSGSVDLQIARMSLADMQALFSSRGPRRGDSVGKPDLAAPGVVITSVGLGNAGSGGTGASFKSGTSMAAPHVAGLAALLRQRNPTWAPYEIKAALVNTARDVSFDPEETPPQVGPFRMGAGRVQSVPALATELLVIDDLRPDRVGLSFGALEAVGDLALERQVRLVNHGSATTVHLSMDPVADLPGASYEIVGPTSLPVPSGGTVVFPVRLSVAAAQLRPARDPSQESALFGFSRFWLSPETAYLTVAPDGGPPLRLPVQTLVRPASDMAAVGPVEVGPTAQGSAQLELSGLDFSVGEELPEAERALLTLLELSYLAAEDPEVPDLADIAWLGVAPSLVEGEPGLIFGVAAHGAASSPSELSLQIFLDTDLDDTDDFVLYASDWGSFTFGSFATDGFVSVLRDLATDAESVQAPLGLLPPGDWSTVPFQSTFKVLGVKASALGGLGAFRWRVELAEAEIGNQIAGAQPPTLPLLLDDPAPGRHPRRSSYSATTSPALTYDLDRPGVRPSPGLGGYPIYFDLDSAFVDFDYDLEAFADHGSLGVLLLHHHNTSDGSARPQAEAAALNGPFADVVLRLEASPDPVAFDGRAVYTATVLNQGFQTAEQVELELELDAALGLDVGALPSECQQLAGTVVCDLGDLPAGSSRELEIAAAVDSEPGAVLRIEASARVTAGLEINPLNNGAGLDHRVSDRYPIPVPALGGWAAALLAALLLALGLSRLTRGP